MAADGDAGLALDQLGRIVPTFQCTNALQIA
jgi:hypothetical protein